MRPNSTVPCQCWVEPTLVSSPARHCLRSCVSTWWSCILLRCCMECEGRKSSTCGCYLSHPVPRTVRLQRLQLPPQLTNQSETSRARTFSQEREKNLKKQKPMFSKVSGSKKLLPAPSLISAPGLQRDGASGARVHRKAVPSVRCFQMFFSGGIHC